MATHYSTVEYLMFPSITMDLENLLGVYQVIEGNVVGSFSKAVLKQMSLYYKCM